jgi:hypothetical protein
VDSSIIRWKSRVKDVTFKNYQIYFNLFMEWVLEVEPDFREYSPDDLIDYQKSATGEDRYRILDLVETWIGSKEGRHGYKSQLLVCVRSFFMHNRAELPKDPGFRVKADKPKVIGTLTVNELKQVCIASEPKYRGAFSVHVSGCDGCFGASLLE